MEKMEALPIGTPKHRNKVLTERIIGTNTNRMPEYICLIKDGEPMRILGLMGWKQHNNRRQMRTMLVFCLECPCISLAHYIYGFHSCFEVRHSQTSFFSNFGH